jgi:hypothetical protein
MSRMRLEQMWAMRPAERIQAALEGRFTLGEMLRWASRRPSEPPLVDGEWFFLSAYLADCEAASVNDASPVDTRRASLDTSQRLPAAAGDTSRRRSR